MPYPRPIRFTNAELDTESLAAMNATLMKRDSDMQVVDIERLFSPTLLGGTYAEQVYFLPLAFTILENNPEQAFGTITGIIYFVAEHQVRLEHDRLWYDCRHSLTKCFRRWTNRFDIIHFDELAMRAKGSMRQYGDVVLNSYPVARLLSALGDYNRLKDLVGLLIEELAALPGSMPRSAWYLECCRMISMGMIHFDSNNKSVVLGHASQVLVEHVDAVRAAIGEDAMKSSYWRDTLEILAC